MNIAKLGVPVFQYLHHYRQVAESINQANKEGKSRLAWKLFDQYTSFHENIEQPIASDIKPKIKAHFRAHFNQPITIPLPPELEILL